MNKKKILLIGYGYWGKIIANQLNKKKILNLLEFVIYLKLN